jgi:hypothetical protein
MKECMKNETYDNYMSYQVRTTYDIFRINRSTCASITKRRPERSFVFKFPRGLNRLIAAAIRRVLVSLIAAA